MSNERERMSKLESSVEEILNFMNIKSNSFKTKLVYEHWYKFILFLKHNIGLDKDSLMQLLRAYIGIDYRYLGAYCSSCERWRVIEFNNGKLSFVGIPEKIDFVVPKFKGLFGKEKEESFMNHVKRREKEKKGK